jgi:hypothetical protein
MKKHRIKESWKHAELASANRGQVIAIGAKAKERQPKNESNKNIFNPFLWNNPVGIIVICGMCG